MTDSGHDDNERKEGREGREGRARRRQLMNSSSEEEDGGGKGQGSRVGSVDRVGSILDDGQRSDGQRSVSPLAADSDRLGGLGVVRVSNAADLDSSLVSGGHAGELKADGGVMIGVGSMASGGQAGEVMADGGTVSGDAVVEMDDGV